MKALAIVEDLDIIEDLETRLFSRVELLLIDTFRFERGKKALENGIIPAIAFSAHAASDTECSQNALMVLGSILAASIGVHERLSNRQTIHNSHPERIADELGSYARFH